MLPYKLHYLYSWTWCSLRTEPFETRQLPCTSPGWNTQAETADVEEGSAGGWMFWQGNEKKTDGEAAQTLIPGFLRKEAVGEHIYSNDGTAATIWKECKPPIRLRMYRVTTEIRVSFALACDLLCSACTRK